MKYPLFFAFILFLNSACNHSPAVQPKIAQPFPAVVDTSPICPGPVRQSIQTKERFRYKDLTINYKAPGCFFALSSPEVPDKGPGGYGKAGDRPRKISESDAFCPGITRLWVDTATLCVRDGKWLGHPVYLVNHTDSVFTLRANSSRLPILLEAWTGGEWAPLEFLPLSDCGNSYNTVALDKHEYWEFVAPRYGGNVETALRYSVFSDLRCTRRLLSSNVFEGRVSRRQITAPANQANARALFYPY